MIETLWDYLIYFIFYAGACGLLSVLAVKKKSRSQTAWFWIGFGFGIVGLIAALIVEPLRPTTMKRCPDCSEQIQLEARVCRFCGHQFSDEDITKQIKAKLEIPRSSR